MDRYNVNRGARAAKKGRLHARSGGATARKNKLVLWRGLRLIHHIGAHVAHAIPGVVPYLHQINLDMSTQSLLKRRRCTC
jgi:hypothetical protein